MGGATKTLDSDLTKRTWQSLLERGNTYSAAVLYYYESEPPFSKLVSYVLMQVPSWRYRDATGVAMVSTKDWLGY